MNTATDKTHRLVKLKIPYITLLLILSNILVYYCYQLPTTGGDSLSAFWLYKLGANVSGMTFTGDYWRLLTALFLHNDGTHLLSNMLFLLLIGSSIELTQGRLTLLFVFLIGGLFSSFISAAYHYDQGPQYFIIIVSAGASGAIAALIGFLAQDFVINRDFHDKNFTIYYCVTLAIFLFFGKSVDNAAHIGGFIGGVMLSIPFIMYRAYEQSKFASAVVGVLIVIGLVLFCFGRLNRFNEEFGDSKREQILSYFKKDELQIQQKQKVLSDK